MIAFEFRAVPTECDFEEDENGVIIEVPFGPAAGSEEMISVLRVRKAGSLAAFSHVTNCESCRDACTNFHVCGAPETALVDQGKIGMIQQCLIDDLSDDIGEALFGDSDVEIRLKNVEEFIQALPDSDDEPIAKSDHFVADLKLSVK